MRNIRKGELLVIYISPDAELCDGLVVLLAAGAELLLGCEWQRLPDNLLSNEGLYLGADSCHGHLTVIIPSAMFWSWLKS